MLHLPSPLLAISSAGLLTLAAFCISAAEPPAQPATPSQTQAVPAALNFTVSDIDGKPVNLAQYHGKVVMIVNVASKCGLTTQYAALESLYEKYKDQGFIILAFPCNDFNGQEPGSAEDIKKFCSEQYKVTFPLFSKVTVKTPRPAPEGANDPAQAPLYKFLVSKETNPKFPGEIQWNFTKFLVSRDGALINRFEPRTKPDSEEVVKAIEAALAQKKSDQ